MTDILTISPTFAYSQIIVYSFHSLCNDTRYLMGTAAFEIRNGTEFR